MLRSIQNFPIESTLPAQDRQEDGSYIPALAIDDATGVIYSGVNVISSGGINQLRAGANITLTPSGDTLIISASGGGGGGSPADPSGSIQFNNAGSFGAAPFSSVDPSTGIITWDDEDFSSLTTFIPSASNNTYGPSLMLNGPTGITEVAAKGVYLTNGAKITQFSFGVVNTLNSTSVSTSGPDDTPSVGISVSTNATDNSGTATQIATGVQVQTSLSGSNVAADVVYGVQISSSISFLTGTVTEVTGIQIGSPDSSSSTIDTISGIHIQDQSGFAAAAIVGAAILIEDQSIGSTAYAIKTGTGLVSLGDNITLTAAAIDLGYLSFAGQNGVLLDGGSGSIGTRVGAVASGSEPGALLFSQLGSSAALYVSNGTSIVTQYGISQITPSGTFGIGNNFTVDTSGNVILASINALVGTANPMVLPTTTATATYVLSSDGGNPQQLSWIPAGGALTLDQVGNPLGDTAFTFPLDATIGFTFTADASRNAFSVQTTAEASSVTIASILSVANDNGNQSVATHACDFQGLVSGDSSGAKGGQFLAQSSGSNNIDMLEGVTIVTDHGSSGTLTAAHALTITCVQEGGSGEVLETVALLISDVAGTDLNYAIKTGLGLVNIGDATTIAPTNTTVNALNLTTGGNFALNCTTDDTAGAYFGGCAQFTFYAHDNSGSSVGPIAAVFITGGINGSNASGDHIGALFAYAEDDTSGTGVTDLAGGFFQARGNSSNTTIACGVHILPSQASSEMDGLIIDDQPHYAIKTGTGTVLFGDNVQLNGGAIGFFGHSPGAQEAVTGAKLPSDVVMASLLAALAATGLIIDSTT